MSGRIALLRFPGVNCESETARVLERAGARVDRIQLGDDLDPDRYDGFVLPGGFSYEDRVRAGAVASRSEWMRSLAVADEAGKPILGICNGAQVLVESGIIPGGPGHPVRLALAANAGQGRGGYLCRWVHVEVTPSACPWLRGLDGTRWPVPVAHGEGRFVSIDPEVTEGIKTGALCPLRYVDPEGKLAEGGPWDPNGAVGSAAAVCSERGNAVALMPHPERAAWLRQVPEGVAGEWGNRRRAARTAANLESPGPGQAIFDAFVHAASGVRI